MVKPSDSYQGTYWLPRFQAEIPVSLYINGKQIPPIEAEGEIVSITSTCLHIRCDSKIPIPSKGVVRFSIDDSSATLSMQVNFVQRVEISKSLWPWNSKTTYEMQAALSPSAGEEEGKFKQFVNGLTFGKPQAVDELKNETV